MASDQAPAPFQCPEHDCGAAYKRREYLIRHMATHQAQTYPCPHCDGAFSRKDSVRRHIKLHHRDKELGRFRAAAACARCKSRKTRCEGTLPCAHCLERGLPCVYENPSPPPPPNPQTSASTSLSQQQQQQQAGTAESTAASAVAAEEDGSERMDVDVDITRHVDAYFRHFHPTWPFLHRATFSAARELPLLVQSVLMVGLWAGGDAAGQRAAVDIHDKLRASICQQRDKWDVSNSPVGDDGAGWPMGTYQGILLSVIFTLVTRGRNPSSGGGGSSGGSNSQQMPQAEYEVLAALVKSCKRRGMLSYPRMLAQYDQASLSPSNALYIWIGLEEAKRFALSLYKAWRLCKETGMLGGSGGGEEDEDLLKVEDLEFPMPGSEYTWEAASKEELVKRIEEEMERGNAPCDMEMEWICHTHMGL